MRRLGGVVKRKKLSPHNLLKIEQKDLFNLLLDLISEIEKEGYAGKLHGIGREGGEIKAPLAPPGTLVGIGIPQLAGK